MRSAWSSPTMSSSRTRLRAMMLPTKTQARSTRDRKSTLERCCCSQVLTSFDLYILPLRNKKLEGSEVIGMARLVRLLCAMCGNLVSPLFFTLHSPTTHTTHTPSPTPPSPSLIVSLTAGLHQQAKERQPCTAWISLVRPCHTL